MLNLGEERMKKMFNVFNNGFLVFFSVFLLSLFVSKVCLADGVDSLESAFKGGKFSGTIGNYFEFIASDTSESNSGWSTAYLTLKFETLSWNNLKFGSRFWTHGELYSDHDNGITDPFEVDIESKFTLPEMYLSYGFGEESNVTVGRWQNVGHIDDAESEGGYITFKEIEKLELLAGMFTRFAEIDYDDSEDFGRTNDSQEVDSEATYGAGSGAAVMFLEAQYKPVDVLKLNPYFMYHNNYASVLGLDAGISTEWKEHGIKYGGNVIYQHIYADIIGSSDANTIFIQPFVKKGPVELKLSYSMFDDGDSLNKPAWLKDCNDIIDQDIADNTSDAEVFEALVKYSFDKTWLSFAYSSATYAFSSSIGDGLKDYEFQVGHKITESFDINIRYFIVTFDNISQKDYNKVETLIQFKF